jgi:predicted glycosyltransferase
VTDVLIVATHLHGIGHLQRAAALAKACAAAGLSTVLASGGRPLRALDLGRARLVQIVPALRTRDESFAELLVAGAAPEADRPAGAADLAAREAALAELVRRTAPKVLVTEMYPFGRRKLRGEFEAAIAAARALDRPAALVASVRDVLTDKPAEKTAWMAEAAAPFARVLVHGDPDLIPFAATFAQAEALAGRLSYTGYVAAREPLRTRVAEGEVIVSAGGGAFGRGMLMSALLARAACTRGRAFRWRLLVGDNLPERDFRALELAAPTGVKVQRARPDFGRRLRVAALSISQAGYNTCVQTMAAGCPAVLVPFAGGAETEQTTRARAMAAAGLATAAEGGDEDPRILAAAVDAALAAGPPRGALPKMQGAGVSAEILSTLAAIVSRDGREDRRGVPTPAR